MQDFKADRYVLDMLKTELWTIQNGTADAWKSNPEVAKDIELKFNKIQTTPISIILRWQKCVKMNSKC